VVNNTPISDAVELGAERIYVLSTRYPSCPPMSPPRTALDAAICGISLLVGSRLESDIGHYGREVELIVLPAPNAGQVQPTDFDHSSELIATAYSATRDALAGADAFREAPLAAGSARRLAAVG
jgi:NTE family protein